MNKYCSISILLYLLISQALAQGVPDSLPQFNLGKIAQVNQGDSFITFPTDIGNLEPLMFEANVNPSFVVRKRKDSRLMAVLTAQITIRMYNEESYPVKTPSYIPQISAYYLVGAKNSADRSTIFVKMGHHSNGQDGSFYNDDGNINLQTGNFATNFFEMGWLKTDYSSNLKAEKIFKTSLEVHPRSWMLQELHGQYSGLRWHNAFLAYKLPLKMGPRGSIKANFSLKAETMWSLDKLYDWDTFNIKRLNASVTFYYHPKFLEDIGFFVRYYHGMDYYNIYFQHRLDVFRFGIMTELLRF
ncbi:hypothetical protein [Arenibacter algicola]|uniref:Phosphatidylcholine 1-acylhydrolase n=1 Tax=Arenibacter algicola TaxID=616991 RepID=A0A221UV16_9FLAO|nr:hypothetical protein [Arenibacter algicola]ASO04751.1 hypothetical protein AREALGSMS7_01276 [Arenibacter algicola]MDX1758747.1 hypothetical protein [Arenibacter algicola]|tara:strand:+ start:36257 stop:37156 length:900 start_codon:yes stop_codon:yes gene_type:complete